MTIQEMVALFGGVPPVLKNCAVIAIILSLVEVSPLKLNPWKWLKAFYLLPGRLEKLENEFNADRIFRWRSQILRRADHISNGEKFSKETWDDTIDTIDRYETYCNEHPEIKNGKAKTAIDFLHKKYAEAIENNDFLR